MDLTRTRRALLAGRGQRGETTAYNHADQLLDMLNIIQEDAQESLEDQMRINQQSITTDDVRVFVERSVEHLTRAVFELDSPEHLLTLMIEHFGESFESALGTVRKQIAEEQAYVQNTSEDLGGLDDHPF